MPSIRIFRSISRGERLKMPFSLFVNHAFVDGAHIARLVALAQASLRMHGA
ncbi:hypothetical protein [Alistipes sp.]|uniref:hypothetical protein n=1 Tax=Alistipes sp. TaxID=1872444 RepID=UPI003AF0474F